MTEMEVPTRFRSHEEARRNRWEFVQKHILAEYGDWRDIPGGAAGIKQAVLRYAGEWLLLTRGD